MADIVRLDGRKYELSVYIRSNTLSIYDCQDPKIPRLRAAHTACWRGYVGVWEIRDEALLLVDLRETYDAQGKEQTNRFAELFPGHPTGLVASWFTGVLTLNKPNSGGYSGGANGMTFAQEVHVEVVEGRVRSCRQVDNSDKVRAYMKILDARPRLAQLRKGMLREQVLQIMKLECVPAGGSTNGNNYVYPPQGNPDCNLSISFDGADAFDHASLREYERRDETWPKVVVDPWLGASGPDR